jgi:ElaB/YqjD/DUF883 family membrane-anchored ribosome-binding protein
LIRLGPSSKKRDLKQLKRLKIRCDLKAGLENRLSDMRESLENARESFDDVLETGRTTIQERPLMAVGLALTVGAVIGFLLASTGKD